MNRRDAETQSEAEMAEKRRKTCKLSAAVLFVFLPLCLCVSAINLSCGSKVTDMRSLAPADSLVYLETNDLAAALQPLVDSKPFTEVAKYQSDLSPLKGVQVAVAVTGFETSEQKLSDESSVGHIQPHFVAIADTHAWNVQAVTFAEQKLGSFVAKMYGSEPAVEKREKDGGTYFTWTAADGRRAFALVVESLIYFGNDESSIEKALAVRRGEADSIVKTGKVAPVERRILARGYVSSDGIGQLANLAALKAAIASSEEPELRSTIAVLLPELIRQSVRDLQWQAAAAQPGIEDRFVATVPSTPSDEGKDVLAELVDSFFDDIEATSAEDVAAALADANDNTAANTLYRRDDHFTPTTAERRIVTDLGFIGWIISQLNEE